MGEEIEGVVKMSKKWSISIGVVAIVLLGFAGALVYEVKSTEPELITVAGPLEIYSNKYYVNAIKLNFGEKVLIADDFNQVGKKEPIQLELITLIGKPVVIRGYRDEDPDDYYKIYVTEINGESFQNPEVLQKQRGWRWRIRFLFK